MQLGPLVRLLMDRFPGVATKLWTDEDAVEVQVSRDRIVEVLRTLRDEEPFSFFFLADAAAVDYGPDKWFEVIYHLYSDRHPAWLRIRVRVDRQNPVSPTVTDLWEGAMFHEREMYDMMGIVFEGNRDLRRIYMSPDYKSFPQRKDFILPDDAADSAAAGVRPLERPETWDLSRFAEEFAPVEGEPPDQTPAAAPVEATQPETLEDAEMPREEFRPR